MRNRKSEVATPRTKMRKKHWTVNKVEIQARSNVGALPLLELVSYAQFSGSIHLWFARDLSGLHHTPRG